MDYVQTYLPSEEDATHKDGMVAASYTKRSALVGSLRLINKLDVYCQGSASTTPGPLRLAPALASAPSSFDKRLASSESAAEFPG